MIDEIDLFIQTQKMGLGGPNWPFFFKSYIS